MSRDLNDLTTAFKGEVEALLANCKARGYEMRPYFTLRTVDEQAILWRRSRTTAEINQKIAELQGKQALYLAHVIDRVGPHSGEHVTNAIPGLSWHQWGESVDCFWVLDGGAEWSSRRKVNGHNGYHVYAEEAVKLGLTAGGHWQSFKDWPHVQARAESSPAKLFTLEEIDLKMKQDFG